MNAIKEKSENLEISAEDTLCGGNLEQDKL